MLTRRMFLLLLMSAAWLPATQVLAGDDDNGSDNDNSGSGSGNSGSGSGNSGSGNDDDDDNDDDNDASESDDLDQDNARRAVEVGEAIELRKVMSNLRRRYGGRIVNVSLQRRNTRLVYRIRLIDKNNRLLNLVVNARNGQIISGSK